MSFRTDRPGFPRAVHRTRWKPHFQIRSRYGQLSCEISRSIVVGLMSGPSRIICDFEPSPMISWNPKERVLITINPRRQVFLVEAQITGGGSEKEDLLTSWCDALSQKWKDPT